MAAKLDLQYIVTSVVLMVPQQAVYSVDSKGSEEVGWTVDLLASWKVVLMVHLLAGL